MQLDDLNKIFFSYILNAIYKISLNDEQCPKQLCIEYLKNGGSTQRINS